MFVKDIRLFSRPFAPHLQQKINSASSAIMRVTDPNLLALGGDQERTKPSIVPELLRNEAEFDTHEAGEEIRVRVKVPVTGDVELLEYVPQDGEHLRIRAKITDDLTNGADMQSDTYFSDNFHKPSPNRRSGVVLSSVFPSSATADTIRGWARNLLDQIESCLPAMREQVAAHEDHASAVLAERAHARREALTRVSGLNDELGKGA